MKIKYKKSTQEKVKHPIHTGIKEICRKCKQKTCIGCFLSYNVGARPDSFYLW